MGLGLFWVFAGLLLAVPRVGIADAVTEQWLLVALHAPLPLCLARPDETHPRTSLSLLLTGAALVPTLIIGLETLVALKTRWLAVAACTLAAAGAAGLARERSWGLLAVGAAGTALMVNGAMGARFLGGGEFASLTGLVLLVAALPFATPIARFLKRD
jgi:hypothetical protein